MSVIGYDIAHMWKGKKEVCKSFTDFLNKSVSAHDNQFISSEARDTFFLDLSDTHQNDKSKAEAKAKAEKKAKEEENAKAQAEENAKAEEKAEARKAEAKAKAEEKARAKKQK
jgi:membrane protein involved in colicin uptake